MGTVCKATWSSSIACALIHIPFRLPQISCFTLSLKCFSSDPDNCPAVEIRPLLQFPPPLRAGPVLLTLLVLTLVPSSYRLLHGSIYSFQVVTYSWLLSADVCKIFCIWSCIPDVSMETDVLHVHLLLCHLESLLIYTFLILFHFVLNYTEVQT